MATPNKNTIAPLGSTERTNQLLGGNYFDTKTGKATKPFTPKTSSVNVTSYRDNPDGTTTNFLSDGTQDTGFYTPNKNGSLTFNPSTIPTTVSSQDLKSTPPLVLPNRQIPTEAVGMQGAIDTSLQTAKAQRDRQANLEIEQTRNAKDRNLRDIVQLQEMLGQTGQRTERAYQQAGVDKLQEEYDTFTNQLEQESHSLTRKLEELDKNPQGLFGGALNQEKERVSRESLRKQADIAILQNSALRKYDSARSIADRKIALELEPLKARLETMKFIYGENKELFNTQEKRAYETSIREEERQYKEEEDRKTKGMDLIINALSQGVPTSMAQKAQSLYNSGASVVEIAGALGQYSGDFLSNQIKKASLAKTNVEIEKLRADIKASETPIQTNNLPNTTNGIVTRLMASAKNDKQLDTGERQSLAKARTVIGQLDSLGAMIKAQGGTGFFKGKLGILLEQIGRNADVGAINASLQAVVPNLARGTYGEVGVLTDTDIENYRKTLPRLDRPQDQNDAVMALTLKTVKNSIENTLTGASNSGIDVSGWTQDYITITKQITDIEDRLGISKEAVNSLIAEDPNVAQAVKELYKEGYSDGEILDLLNAR